MRHILSTMILAACGTLAIHASVKVTNLQTCYQQNPMGLEEQPVLSWQMENDDDKAYGTSQTAYEIVVARTEADLAAGHYLYDTGKRQGSLSVGIPYEGTLDAATRYHWKVRIWDEKDKATAYSDAAWFETGLAATGWNGAQWIGSKYRSLSRYRSNYVIDYDVELGKATEATFLFGVRDSATNVAVTLRRQKNNYMLTLSHLVEGRRVEDAAEDVTPLVDKEPKHHVRLSVFSAQYLRSYNIDIALDGQTVKNSHAQRLDQSAIPEFLRAREGEFVVKPYADEKLYTDCRLYAIGYEQAQAGATFSGITISDETHHEQLYADSERHTTKAGQPATWLPSLQASAPMLRKSFTLRGRVAKARLYATARGIYEMTINGKAVSHDYYNPGWTDYRYRLMYNTFDVTSLLHQGLNAIGATLGSGFYSDFVGFNSDWQDQYGNRLSLLAKLVVTYEDGSTDVIVTDGSWQQYNQGPVVENSMHNGESYDARKELTGNEQWEPVTIVEAPAESIAIQSYIGETIQEKEVRRAAKVEEPRRGIYVYDMGVNMVGVPRLRLKGRAGQTVTVRYGEMIWPHDIPTNPVKPYTVEQYRQNEGLVYTDNYRSAMSTDRYTLRGDGDGETFEPRFTQHGYRYIQIEGLEAPLALSDVEGVVLHSMNSQQLSSYETSDTLTNQLFKNILWGQKGNFLSVPTDCPQRDERLGWMGDAQIFSLAATYNYNVAPFFHRWMNTVRDNQDAQGNYANFCPNTGAPAGHTDGGGEIGWTEAGLVIPWNLYVQYADHGLLAEHYPSMKRYMDYLERKATDYVLPGGSFGDWLSFEPTETQFINNGWFALDAQLMAKAARALGHEADALHYDSLSLCVKEAFQKAFFDPDGRTRIPAGGQVGVFAPVTIDRDSLQDTETSYIMPLHVGIAPDSEQATNLLLKAIERNDGLLSTGFVGTPWLCQVLSEGGHSDAAYRLFQERRFPSWLYPVTQGATTIWERWNSYTREQGFGPVDMNSFNHYSYGAIEEWMMKYSLGIQADEAQPGYKHFVLKPQVGGTFSHVSGSIHTVYGLIESGWERRADGTVSYTLRVPANTTATLILPGKISFVEGKQGAKTNKEKNSYELKSGEYKIISSSR